MVSRPTDDTAPGSNSPESRAAPVRGDSLLIEQHDNGGGQSATLPRNGEPVLTRRTTIKIIPLPPSTEGVLALSPDGRRIVSGSEDDTLRLWPGPEAWPELLCDKLVAT
jgi:WD40 repeat protein